MLERLGIAEYGRVDRLFAPLGHHLAVRALVGGVVPGHVYADDPEQPTAALAWTQQRMFLAGTPSNVDLLGVIAGGIGAAVKGHGSRYLALYYASEDWASVIEEQLQPLAPRAATRHYCEFGTARHDWRQLLPEGFTLRPVDRALLGEAGLAHLDWLRAEMCSERSSVEEFIARSFGVCVVHDGSLAGWCLSEYNHAGACEVGIETLPEHRRRRLATLMATALAERARAEGIERIGWHCYAHNTASVATARSAGFVKATEYPAVVLDLTG